MKSYVLFIVACLMVAPMSSQEAEEEVIIPLIGAKAPSFTAESTAGEITFPKDFSKNWKILFSHPADFTPVCTSEILELAAAQKDFKEMNVEFAVLSTDQLERHNYWVESMEQIDYQKRGKQTIDFPLIADPGLKVSKLYGMIHPESGSTKDVRGVFIIDPKNNIRSIFFYPKETGRNIEEIKRTIVALQRYDNKQVMTPANWDPGEDVIVPYLQYSPSVNVKKAKEKNGEVYEVAWYMFMKKDEVLVAENKEE